MKQLSEGETVKLLLFLTDKAHALLDQEHELAEERRKTSRELARRHAEIKKKRSETADARHEVVASLVTDHGWTQYKVAKLLGISVPRVSYIVNRRSQLEKS